MSETKPVMYLDVDDTLLVPDRPPIGQRAAPGAREFVLWALEHYEVRWLTMWCPSGVMADHRRVELAAMLGIPADLLAGIRGQSFTGNGFVKTDGIVEAEHLAGRPFVWVEDEILKHEKRWLARRGWLDRWIPCNATREPGRLADVHRQLTAERAA